MSGRGMEGWNALVIPLHWEGACPWCAAALRIGTHEHLTPVVAATEIKRDARAKEEAHHAAPTCPEYQRAELVDVCVRALGGGPTPKDGLAT